MYIFNLKLVWLGKFFVQPALSMSSRSYPPKCSGDWFLNFKLSILSKYDDDKLQQNVKYDINKFRDSDFLLRDAKNAKSFDRIRKIKSQDKVIVYGYLKEQPNIPKEVKDLILIFHSFLMIQYGDLIENYVSRVIKHNMIIERKEILVMKSIKISNKIMIKKSMTSSKQFKYRYLTRQKRNDKLILIRANRKNNSKYHRW